MVFVAASQTKSSANRIDALCVFTLLFAQCLALQVGKDVQTLGWDARAPWRLVPTVALAVAIVWAHLRPRDTRTTLWLAVTGVLAVTINGSQSNHVLLELTLCVAVLLAAPKGCFGRDGSISARAEFSQNLTHSTRLILATLYFATGFAKLNTDWHNPKVSCCIQMFVAALGGVGVSPSAIAKLLPETVQNATPIGATAFELTFPVLMGIGVYLNRKQTQRTPDPLEKGPSSDQIILRLLAIGGGAFHVLIALPPPPMSVYPFSMLMAPFYVAALVPGSVDSTFRNINKWQDEAKTVSSLFLCTLFAHTYQLSKQLDDKLFEYPSYGSWRVGVLWNVLVFGFVVLIAANVNGCAGRLSGDEEEDEVDPAQHESSAETSPPPATAEEHENEPSESTPKITKPSLLRIIKNSLPALCIAACACLPYFGVRTYPAFAMFSNLRVEGGFSNHFLVGRGAKHADYPSYEHVYGADVALQIVQTTLPSLRNLQINLAPLAPSNVLQALELTGITSEFHITPPKWRAENPEAENIGSRARPVSVPLVEVRRRIAEALANKKSGDEKLTSDFVVKYRWVMNGTVEKKLNTFSVKNGKVVGSLNGRDAVLAVPMPKWRQILHRFRTFDPEGDSVCRH